MNNTQNQKMKYFMYARKSSESEDRQMNSIEDQLRILKDIAKKNNLNIVTIFHESGSAKKTGRKEFTKMMDEIHQGKANAILTWKLNRLARNSLEGGLISHSLQTSILKQILTPEKTYYPDDNVLMMAVELGMATQYSRDLSKDTKRGLLEKARRGWSPTPPPLGYIKKPDMKKGEKEMIIDEERFLLIKKLWELVLSGNYNPTQSMNILNDKYGLKNHKNKKVSTNTAYYILRNPLYYGRFEYPKKSGNWFQGKHTPMITKQEFDKVQTMISNHSKTKNDTLLKDLFPYKGNLKCGACNKSITAERKKRITCDCKHRFSALKIQTCPKCNLQLSEMQNPKIDTYTLYHCYNKSCPQKATNLLTLENDISSILKKLDFSHELMDIVFEGIEVENKNENNIQEISSSNTKKQIQQDQKKLDYLLELRLNKEIDSETYKNKKNILEQNLNVLQNNLSIKEKKNLDIKAEYYLNFGKIAKANFENANNFEKKEIFNAISSNQFLIDGKLNIVNDSPFNLLQDLVKAYTNQKDIIRTTKKPYTTTKKAPFQVPNSEMLHR